MQLTARHFLLSIATVASLLAVPPRAEAHCCYEYRFAYYRVQPAYQYVYPAPAPPRWALGLHFAAISTNQMLGEDAVALGGLGGNLRYRGYRWGFELAADGLGGSFVEGQVSRVSVPIQASALLYVIPQGVFNLYLVGGARVVPTVISWDYPELQKDQHFVEYGMHGGAGVDFNLGRFIALTADVRFFGVMRADNEPDGEYYAEVDRGVLPAKTTGLQFNVGVNFRF